MEDVSQNIKNVIKEYREKNEYFQQKLKEQEEKEKELNYANMYQKDNQKQKSSPMHVTEAKKDRLPTIYERETENNQNQSIKYEEVHDDMRMSNKNVRNLESLKKNNEQKAIPRPEQSSHKPKLNITGNKFASSLKESDVILENSHEESKSNLMYNSNQSYTNTKQKGSTMKSKSQIDKSQKESQSFANETSKKPQMINTITDTLSVRNSPNPNKTAKSNKFGTSSKKFEQREEMYSDEEIEFIEEFLVKHVNDTITKLQTEGIKIPKELKMFDHRIYNGKADKVALYQKLTNEWNSYNHLNKKPGYSCNRNNTRPQTTSQYQHTDEEKPSKVDIIVTQKVRNIRRPLSFYKKF